MGKCRLVSAKELSIPTMTGAEALIEAIATKKSQSKITGRSLQEIHFSKAIKTVSK